MMGHHSKPGGVNRRGSFTPAKLFNLVLSAPSRNPPANPSSKRSQMRKERNSDPRRRFFEDKYRTPRVCKLRHPPCFIERLPDELLVAIFEHLAPGGHDLSALCRTNKRISRIAFPLFFRRVAMVDEAAMLSATKLILMNPLIGSAVETLDFRHPFYEPSTLPWDQILPEILGSMPYDVTSPAMRARNFAQNAALRAANKSQSHKHRKVLNGLVFSCPKIRALSFPLLSHNRLGSTNVFESLKPLFSGCVDRAGPEVSMWTFEDPPCFGYDGPLRPGDNGKFIPLPFIPRALRRLEEVRIYLPPSHMSRPGGQLHLTVRLPHPQPARFTSIWARVEALRITSTSFFIKLMEAITHSPKLVHLSAQCVQVEGNAPFQGGYVPNLYPVIHNGDKGRDLLSSIVHLADILESLHLDLLLNSHSFWYVYGVAGCLEQLNSFRNITQLSITLAGAFQSEGELTRLLSLDTYFGDDKERRAALADVFPPALVSLTLIEHWPDSCLFDPFTYFRPYQWPNWVRDQDQQYAGITTLLDVLAAAVPTHLPHLKWVTMSATSLDGMQPRFERYVRGHRSWTNRVSEEELRMKFLEADVNFRLTLRLLKNRFSVFT